MKPLLIGTVIFLATLAVGIASVTLRYKTPVTTDDIVPSESTPEHFATPRPEFTDLSIDESGVGKLLNIEFVGNGETAVCKHEKIEFPNGRSLVLFKRGDRTTLEKVRLEFKPLRQADNYAVYPANFRDSKSAFFILSDTKEIAPGPVQTLYIEPLDTVPSDDTLFQDGLASGDKRTFTLNENTYTIRVSDEPSNNNGMAVRSLVLESLGAKQLIWFGRTLNAESQVVGLRWVGDLDHDGKLDLLFRYFEINGGGSVDVLMLSSHSKPGDLVGPAAFLFARDCH